MLSLLAHIFVPERHRQRAAQVGFSTPALSEVVVNPSAEPLLATNMKLAFLRTRVSAVGYARFGFSECEVAQEQELLFAFYRALVTAAGQENWRNVAPNVPEALERMRGFGVAPQLVVSSRPDEVSEDVVTLGVDFPDGAALVVGPSERAGLYTRVGDHVGVLAQRVSTTFVAVVPT